ncbi:MAG: FprA family A-type flavoprotein [bacterium]|nr:FprA family A-type flavoprotein [bacterium]
MRISDSVLYVGVNDKDIDLFEGQYVVPDGVSYNSYVIMDEKIAIMDTVDKRKTDEWVANLEETLQGKTPDYLVISHMEPDHAASIQVIAEKYPNMLLVGNCKTFDMVACFFDFEFENRKVVVAEGDELSLGQHTLVFVMAPMVHWPEVMVTYEKSEKILFSADGFGTFGALDMEQPWDDEARRYFINIVGKFGAPVQTLLAKAATLEIEKICPLHGPVLDNDLGHYIGKYDTWSSYRPESRGVVIAYASVYGNTEKAAQCLKDKLIAAGEGNVILADLARSDMSEVIARAFQYDRMIVAAPTYDGGIYPIMEDFLRHLKAKAYQKRKVGIIENGSWAITVGRLMQSILGEMKDIEILEPVVTIKSSVKADTEAQIDELVKACVEAGIEA